MSQGRGFEVDRQGHNLRFCSLPIATQEAGRGRNDSEEEIAYDKTITQLR